MKKKKILVFTGAGISAESGINTFRDTGGVWEKYSVEDVASIEGWAKDPQKVLDFYNERKREYSSAKPNDAHKLLVEMEKDFDVTIITQNVDPLHEMAGSSNVIHLHGEICKLKSEKSNYKGEYLDDIKIGDKCPEGHQLRPDIVWFGENLDPEILKKVREEASKSDICIIIGTSMNVEPAAGIPWMTKETSLIYYIDPSDINFYIPKFRSYFFNHFQDVATVGTKNVYDDIIRISKKENNLHGGN